MGSAAIGDANEVHRISLEALADDEAAAAKGCIVLMRCNHEAAPVVLNGIAMGPNSHCGPHQLKQRAPSD
jgi:hypothetical protein